MDDLDLETLLLPRSADQKLKLSFSEAVPDVAARYPKLTFAFYLTAACGLGVKALGPSIPTIALSTAALIALPVGTPLLGPFHEALTTLGGKTAKCRRHFLWAAKYDRVQHACAKREGAFSKWRETRALRKAEQHREKAKALWVKSL